MKLLKRKRRKIVVFLDKMNQWRFRIVGDNGEPIAQSEGYLNWLDMLDTVRKYFPRWRIEDEDGMKIGA